MVRMKAGPTLILIILSILVKRFASRFGFSMLSPGQNCSAPAAIRCALCGDEAPKPIVRQGIEDYLTRERFDITRCGKCGLLATSPCPDESAMARYYPPRYRGNRHGFTGHLRVVLRRRAIEARFPAGFKGRILDVGAGDGSFALEMQRRGWNIAATEIDPGAVDRLRAQGIDAKLSSVAEQEGFSESFDAVTAWHVLEHVQHPRAVADWVRDLLAPTGTFQATVPNAGCWQEKIFGGQWLHLDVPRHRYHFAPATFTRLMRDAGFAIEKSNCLAIEYDWFGAIQSTLNLMCSEKNILFDLLTRPIGGDRYAHSDRRDRFISIGLCGPIAAAFLPMVIGAAAMGNGATLTLSCTPVTHSA